MAAQYRPHSITYRPDIDGLRAVAILPVVFYHGGLPGFGGGYVGVDIFFVISGFLITSLLLKEIDAGTFRFTDFWLRRARRILPAVFVVMAACLVAGWFLLFPAEFVKLAESALAQSVFLSNVFFWSETGYFAAPAQTQPLLHVWSLAIEEQYYLLFPVILVLLSKHLHSIRLLVILGAALVSLGLSIFDAFDDPEAAFFGLHSRAWELLVGSLLALLALQRADPDGRPSPFDQWLGGLGLAAIAVSVAGFSETTPFPGVAALVPTGGAAAIIWANRHGLTWSGVLLARPLPVGIGLISYSLYLWHWPIFVYAKIISYPTLDRPWTAAVIALSFLAAWLSYKFVEMPIRRRAVFISGRALTAAALTGLVVLVAGSAAIRSSDGIEQRFDADINAVLAARVWPTDIYECAETFQTPCPIGDAAATDRVDFVLWGDSHAQALLPLATELARRYGLSGIFWGTPCPPILGAAREKRVERCTDGNTELVSFLNDTGARLVIVAARWSMYTEGFTSFELDLNEKGTRYIADETSVAGSTEAANRMFARHFAPSISKLAEITGRVAVMGEVPIHWFDPVDCLARSLAAPDRCATPRDRIRARMQFLDSQFAALDGMDGVTTLNPRSILCDADDCPAWIDGLAAYKNDDHVSYKGVMLLEPLLEPIFAELAGETAN